MMMGRPKALETGRPFYPLSESACHFNWRYLLVQKPSSILFFFILRKTLSCYGPFFDCYRRYIGMWQGAKQDQKIDLMPTYRQSSTRLDLFPDRSIFIPSLQFAQLKQVLWFLCDGYAYLT